MSSVADRYARSVGSSHLETTEFTGDIDALIASGWVRESLATMLWRLRVEFDRVDKQSLTRGTQIDITLALSRMRSLPSTKAALRTFATSHAQRGGITLTDSEADGLTATILNHFLDSQCKVCNGVKFKTVPGTGRLSANPCDECKGSGRSRVDRRSQGMVIEAMAAQVLLELDRKIAVVAAVMGRFLRQTAAGP